MRVLYGCRPPDVKRAGTKKPHDFRMRVPLCSEFLSSLLATVPQRWAVVKLTLSL
ncbi:hypothetical protein [Xylella fastidiosa]|uniref:hypothetical protein n=1 Tax=Xylella fastidiosa TaxID=2371 RepID=UPI001386CACE|nr:hypothetical protein [Xylella fastidiosa]